MKYLIIVFALLTLTACGSDGETKSGSGDTRVTVNEGGNVNIIDTDVKVGGHDNFAIIDQSTEETVDEAECELSEETCAEEEE